MTSVFSMMFKNEDYVLDDIDESMICEYNE